MAGEAASASFFHILQFILERVLLVCQYGSQERIPHPQGYLAPLHVQLRARDHPVPRQVLRATHHLRRVHKLEPLWGLHQGGWATMVHLRIDVRIRLRQKMGKIM